MSPRIIKATKANDYHNMNPGGSKILIADKILHQVKAECEQLNCKEILLSKYNNDLVRLEVEDEYDVENCTNTDHADDNDDDGNEDDDEEDDDEDEERDLTNLTWLTELSNQTMGFVNIALDEETKKDNEFKTVVIEQVSIQQPSHFCHLSENDNLFKSDLKILEQKNLKIALQVPKQKSNESCSNKILNQSKRPSPAERYEMFVNKIKRDLEIYEESAINYQTDIVEKPPFNYSHIIGMAMLENGRRVTLQQICSWIEKKFAFFRGRKKWNNSIRHNLSLHPCFRKIGRNKEDKGKGGYWELGVDPKKCDRKRIRNRKSTAQSIKMQKKHLQSHLIKSTKRRQQSFASTKKFNFKPCNGNLRNFTSDQEYEELLLDEMDVQQNIDVMSTNMNNSNNIIIETGYKHSQSHSLLQQIQSTTIKHNTEKEDEEEILITHFIRANNNDHNDDHDDDDDDVNLQRNDDFESLNKNYTLANSDISQGNEQSLDQMCRHQNYKLDTIIMKPGNVDADMPNIQNINQRPINTLLTTSPTKQLLTEQQQCASSICYSEVEDVPHIDNVIISSYISNLSDGLFTCSQETKSNQHHNVTLDFSAFPAHSIQRKPNVIVEQLIQQPSLTYSAIEIPSECMPTITPSLLNSSTATMCAIGTQNGDLTNGLINDHFRPYIDGIDEAFQYLRSLDNTRNEDILDNFLDISVSDY